MHTSRYCWLTQEFQAMWDSYKQRLGDGLANEQDFSLLRGQVNGILQFEAAGP